MTEPARVEWEMRCRLPATYEAAEEFIAEFRRQTQAVLDREGCFAAELLVREALTNAVRHGCQNDPRKHVRCSVRLKGGRLLFTVADGGLGFDWRAMWSNQAATSDCSGRGIEILRKYASRVRYNNRGNAIAIVKRFSEENQP